MANDKLNKLIQMLDLLQNDTLKPSEVERFLLAITDVIKKERDSFRNLSAEHLQRISDALNYINSTHADAVAKIGENNSKLSEDILIKLNAKIDSALAQAKSLVEEIQNTAPKDGLPGKDGSPDTAEQVRDKLESLTGENRLDAAAIKNLPQLVENKVNTFGGVMGLKDVVAGTNITIDKTNLGYPVISATGTGAVDSVNGKTGTVVLTTADIADSLNKRYVTDAELTVLGNTSGTNTGDQTISDATISLSDITTNNFSITKHGFVPKGTNVGNFLKDDGTWAAVSGTGTVTSVSVASANGFAGTVANATTTPAITLTTSITGVLKGNGTAISAATDGTDYLSSTTGVKLDQTVGQTIGTTGARLTKLWATDITVTNAIAGSVTGNAGTVSNATFTTALTVNTGTVTLTGNAANTSVLTIGAGAVSVSGSNTGDQTSVSGNAGTATALQNARTIAGTSFDGTANIALANKFIVQGTTDSGLSGAQFLGALGTGIVKNTTTTGVLSIAVAGDFPTLNQSTTGSAATLTTPRAIYGNNFDGSAALTQVIASTFGGTGNGFTKFTGPTTSEKTFTLPDSSQTLLYSGGALGTPSSGTATNLTGTATGLTVGITNALKSATTTVDVSAATAPSAGQVLTATDSTHATWQTPSGGSTTATMAISLTSTNGWSNNTSGTAGVVATIGNGLTINVGTAGSAYSSLIFQTMSNNSTTYYPFNGNPIVTFPMTILTTVGTGNGEIFIGVGDDLTGAGGATWTNTVNRVGFSLRKVSGTVNIYFTQGNGTNGEDTASLTTAVAGDIFDFRVEITTGTSAKGYYRKNGGSWTATAVLSTYPPSANLASHYGVAQVQGTASSAVDYGIKMFGSINYIR